jgi:hypothetical protein
MATLMEHLELDRAGAEAILKGHHRSMASPPSARTHRWTTGHRRQRPCIGRLRYADQLRRTRQPWRQNRSCTNIQPRPPDGETISARTRGEFRS